MKVFVPVKTQSERVPGKNFRELGGVPLWRRCLLKFASWSVYVDTDSRRLIERIRCDPALRHVTPIERRPELRGGAVSVNRLIEDFLDRGVPDYRGPVAQVHVTHPFFEPQTIGLAARILDDADYDSVVGCNVLQSRLWRCTAAGYRPVNHDPAELLPTQRLERWFEDNSTFYLFTPASFRVAGGNRVGNYPYFYRVPWPQSLDIDTEDQWRTAALLDRALAESVAAVPG